MFDFFLFKALKIFGILTNVESDSFWWVVTSNSYELTKDLLYPNNAAEEQVNLFDQYYYWIYRYYLA